MSPKNYATEIKPVDLAKLTDLITRVLAYEANQILRELKHAKPDNRHYTKLYGTNPQEYKDAIRAIYLEYQNNGREFISPEEIRDIALGHLQTQERIVDPKLNPSFTKLRERLDDKAFDFFGKLGIPEYRESE
jgi:hypothetical protein